MSRLSIVIFGATGFTGKHVVAEMVRLSKKYPALSWAVAGRSHSRLEALLKEVAQNTGEDLSNIRMIIADVTDAQSLKDMCSEARVVANCCGPYRLYGEPVVTAAIECKTHVVDITGEPQFMETMQLKYDALAREAGVAVVSACGFDCVPSDLGTLFLQTHFGGTVNSVESYLSSELPPHLRRQALSSGIVHYGTWESLVYGLAHYGELRSLRKQLYPEPMPPRVPALPKRSVLHRAGAGWAVPFPGADASLVRRSQRRLRGACGTRPAQFRIYVKWASVFAALESIIAAAFLYIMAQFSLTRSLLLNYPRVFTLGMVTHSGPTEDVMKGTTFKMELIGEGWKEGSDINGKMDRRVKALVSGSNPGYGLTAMTLIYSAITLLQENEQITERGILTPAVAFRKTKLIDHLHENGMKFEIIETTDI